MRTGDVVKVHQKVPVSAKGKQSDKEKKERLQIFEGVVLAMKHGKGINGTFIVRKIISGIGVEKTYPLHSPNIDKIEIVSRSKVRRAKLYYLRERAGKKAKLKRSAFDKATPLRRQTSPEAPAEGIGLPRAERNADTPIADSKPSTTTAVPSVNAQTPESKTKKEK